MIGALCFPLATGIAQSAEAMMRVFKSPTCGCCTAWVDHMIRAGVSADVRDIDDDRLWALKMRSGLKPEMTGCHTAFIDGYVVEGHVPATDVLRLLTERPDAIGLAVPGMPLGSPGMEMGHRKDRYATLLVLRSGATEVFTRHG